MSELVAQAWRAFGLTSSKAILAFVVVPVAACLLAVLIAVIFRNGRRMTLTPRAAAAGLLTIYLGAMIVTIALLPAIPIGSRWGWSRVELMPLGNFYDAAQGFHWDRSTALESAANALLFVPIGMSLGGWTKASRTRHPLRIATLLGLGLSILCELLQYLLPTWRVVSINDVIANTCGAFVGAVILMAVVRAVLMLTALPRSQPPEATDSTMEAEAPVNDSLREPDLGSLDLRPAWAGHAWGRGGETLRSESFDLEYSDAKMSALPDFPEVYPASDLLLVVWPTGDPLSRPVQPGVPKDDWIHEVTGPWSLTPDVARRIRCVIAVNKGAVVGFWEVAGISLRLRTLQTRDIDLGCAFTLRPHPQVKALAGLVLPQVRADIVMVAPAEQLDRMLSMSADA